MARLRPEEVSLALKKELERFKSQVQLDSIGHVIQVGDGIARIYGLDDAMAGELLEFPAQTMGMVFNLEEHHVGAVILGSDCHIKDGDVVKRTGRIASVPVGKALLGRVVDALGRPIDGKGPIAAEHSRPIESRPPNVIQRQPVKEPVQTGIKAIDSMIPIGRGQRELILGDRQIGKTALLVDTILNQKDKDLFCIYVAIGQKLSSVVAVVETLEKYGAM
ncbi:MAG: F0F1 ATP synthase subunit alpha, partial [Candidatus Omnitrophica bacterium]|nr:F0F1 ATP synthase subunit alpha [Candidatus Omnitrophota bacterium]